MEHTIKINVLMLTGKEALVVPCLATVGAASILSATAYGVYKLGRKVSEKMADIKCSKEQKESS